MQLERLELSGELLTCLHSSKSGRCVKYVQTCDGDDCISESPKHPIVPGRQKRKTGKKKTTKKATTAKTTKKTVKKLAGKKAPWEMTKIEWNKAVDATHPGTPFTSKATKGSGAELDRKLTEHLRLNYDAGILDLATNRVITDHKLVVAKAYQEGKKISKQVLEQYPDMPEFVESAEYQESRGTLTDAIEENEKSRQKHIAEKKLLQIDTVYDTDLENAIKRVIELKPTTNYYLRVKSPKRTWVDSSTPFRGQSYVMVDKDWKVTRFDNQHKQIEHSDLAQNDGIYDSDMEATTEMITNLPADRTRGAKYYLTKLPDNRTKVESKTPGGTGPYIRVDYRGIARFDENRKQIQKPVPPIESWKNALQPPNASKWEVEKPPKLLDPEPIIKTKRAIGEYTYLVGNRTERESGKEHIAETDYQAVRGEPVTQEGLEFLHLFAHKSIGEKKGITISEVSTGMSLAHGENKTNAIKTLKQIAQKVKSSPEVAMQFSRKLSTSRKIAEYPQLEVVYKRIFSQLPLPEPVSGLGLSGDLLTCHKWKIRGGPGNKYIKCESYKRTCQEGDPDCVEPVTAKTKTKAKAKADDYDPAAWMRRNPFTKADNAKYNAGPSDDKDMNKLFEGDVQRKIDIVLKEMSVLGVKEMPEAVGDALSDYRMALYNTYSNTAEIIALRDNAKTPLLREREIYVTEALRKADQVVFTNMKRMSSEALDPGQKKTQVKEGLEIKTYQDVEFTVPGGVKKTGKIISIHDGVVYVIPDGGSSSIPAVTVESVAPPTKRVGKKPQLVSGPYGAFWFNVVKSGTRVNQIPKEVIGADFEDYLDAGKGRSYLVFAHGQVAAEKQLNDNLDRIRALRKEHGQGFISDAPMKQTVKRPGEQTLTYHVQPVEDYQAYIEFLGGKNTKDLVDSRLVMERTSIVPGKAQGPAPTKYDAVRKRLTEEAQKAKNGDQFSVYFYNTLWTPDGKAISVTTLPDKSGSFSQHA